MVALGRVYMDWHVVPVGQYTALVALAKAGMVEMRVRDGGGYDARLSFDGRRYMSVAAHEWE